MPASDIVGEETSWTPHLSPCFRCSTGGTSATGVRWAAIGERFVVTENILVIEQCAESI
jgi:hypothetical protein